MSHRARNEASFNFLFKCAEENKRESEQKTERSREIKKKHNAASQALSSAWNRCIVLACRVVGRVMHCEMECALRAADSWTLIDRRSSRSCLTFASSSRLSTCWLDRCMLNSPHGF